MASSMIVSSAPTMTRSSPAQTNMVAPFTGLKSSAAFPISRKMNADLSALPSNGGRVSCMKVWPPEGLKKFETFSYLPTFTDEELIKEVDYLIRNGWVPCIEFAKVAKMNKKVLIKAHQIVLNLIGYITYVTGAGWVHHP